MVISSGVCSKASYQSFEVVLILPASAGGRCESECFQGSQACPISMTPILFPATLLLAEHAPERGTTRFPYQTIEQNCVARVGKADGHEQKGQKMNQIVRRNRTTLPQADISHKAHGIRSGTLRTREGHCKVHLRTTFPYASKIVATCDSPDHRCVTHWSSDWTGAPNCTNFRLVLEKCSPPREPLRHKPQELEKCIPWQRPARMTLLELKMTSAHPRGE